jgi:16S rRNA G966 N2-methylase RsmD
MEQLKPLVLLHFSTVEPVGQPDKIVTWPPTAGFKPYDRYFTKESVKHPAKANLHMIKWIIETYTKEGDWILDPMAGTGSTGIMALLLGRNAILVEYEQKFVDMINSNLVQLIDNAPINSCLQWKVLKGDARKLTELLCDQIIFSPPYADASGSRDHNRHLTDRQDKSAKWIVKNTRKMEETNPSWGSRHTEGRLRGLESLQSGYGDSNENIGNLPYGEMPE